MTRRHLLGGATGEALGEADGAVDGAVDGTADGAVEGLGDGKVNDPYLRCGRGLPNGGGMYIGIASE